MKTNRMTGRGSRGLKGGATRTSRKRMISKNNATQTPNESIIESVGDLFIVLDAEMNEPHVNARGGALPGRKVMGTQIAVMRAEFETQRFGDSK